MSSDMEELVREGTRQFTATMRVSPDLAARTCERHRRRLRHKLTGISGAAAAVAMGTALAVAALLPAGHQPGHQPSVQLAAWTVAKEGDGAVHVTFRELRDPAGLQSKLRADGVPAYVSFIQAPLPGWCRPYLTRAASKNLFRVYQIDPGNPRTGTPTRLVIQPSALPAATGVWIITSARRGPGITLGVGLIQASQRCTGS